jgi:Ca-activated chloride channel family protein
VTSGRTAGATESWAPPSFTFVLPRGDAYGTPYSPTHQLDIVESRDRGDRFGREARVVGDASRLTLLVPVRNAAAATVTALSHAPPNEDGFALIQLSPPIRRTAALPRDVTFVVDVSGSMSGGKLEQAKAAGRTLLGTLSSADRFRLVSFATDVEQFRDGWSPATAEHMRAARQWLDDLRATGSTNISGALETALDVDSSRGRLGVVLFLTDGTATVGERNPERLAEMASRRRGGQRVFTFGVGADVQAAMLERIALEGRGTAHFVQPSEDVEYAVGVVAQRLTSPVATNVRVRAEGVSLRQVHPDGPQDVFVGQDLTLFVRYRGNGVATLVFEGDSPSGPVRWTERVTLLERSRDNAFVAKLWAVQRVGWLSAERRRVGANSELDAELRDLGTKYGIPTELSSYLVLEPGMQPANLGSRPVPLVEQGVVGAGVGGGRGAGTARDFAAARVAAEQRAATSLAAAPSMSGKVADAAGRAEADGVLRQVGDRTFVHRGGRWTDTRAKETLRRLTVKPFSPAYFALIERVPELKVIFALGDKVTTGGRAIVIALDEEGTERLAESELATIVRDW